MKDLSKFEPTTVSATSTLLRFLPSQPPPEVPLNNMRHVFLPSLPKLTFYQNYPICPPKPRWPVSPLLDQAHVLPIPNLLKCPHFPNLSKTKLTSFPRTKMTQVFPDQGDPQSCFSETSPVSPLSWLQSSKSEQQTDIHMIIKTKATKTKHTSEK